MGTFNQVEFNSLAPYEQKQYEMDNPRPRAPRGSGFEASHDRFMANVSKNVEGKEKIDKATEAYRSRVGSDAGGKSTGGGGGMPKINRDITKNYKKGGSVSSASKRADGCATKGKTKGRMV